VPLFKPMSESFLKYQQRIEDDRKRWTEVAKCVLKGDYEHASKGVIKSLIYGLESPSLMSISGVGKAVKVLKEFLKKKR